MTNIHILCIIIIITVLIIILIIILTIILIIILTIILTIIIFNYIKSPVCFVWKLWKVLVPCFHNRQLWSQLQKKQVSNSKMAAVRLP